MIGYIETLEKLGSKLKPDRCHSPIAPSELWAFYHKLSDEWIGWIAWNAKNSRWRH
jgi:hypothetical protein